MGVYRRMVRGKLSKAFYMDFEFDGHRIFKSTGCFTKKEALQAEADELDRLKAEKEEARKRKSRRYSTLTLKEAIEKGYKERWAVARDGDTTRKRLIIISELCGDVALSDIDLSYINTLKVKLQEKGRAPATINRFLAHLKTLLNMARDEWGAIDNRPKVKLTPEKNGRTRVIEWEELEKVVETLRGTDHHRRQHYSDLADFFLVLFDTGMRAGEARKMTYSKHIDFKQGVIHITPDIAKTSEERDVPMISSVRQILEARKDLGDRPFPFSKGSVSSAWRFVKRELGIDEREFTPHALRHTLASRLIAKRVDLYTVKAILGHSSIKTTERYAHMQHEQIKNAVGLLEE